MQSSANAVPADTAAAPAPASIWRLDLTRDGWILMASRFVRLFSYGWLAVGLIQYLLQVGLTQVQIGILFTATMLGDLIVTFWLTTTADAFGRRTTLIISSLLKIFAGVAYAFQGNFIGLLIAGFIGIISPTGGEIGPYLAIEQSSLTESIAHIDHISIVFGWYMFLGYCAQACGALCAGYTIWSLETNHAWSALAANRAIIVGYGFFGAVMFALYCGLSTAIEPLHTRALSSTRDWFGKFGLHRAESRKVVFKLSMLFVLDAFAGGFVMQTVIVYWFQEEFAMSPDKLGWMMMGANIFAGVSALLATPLVHKIGAINTMVFTHLPSNILLLCIPFMPNATLGVILLLARFSISQMDVPARSTYVATVVDADERSAAGGITSVVRSIGLIVSPLLVGYLLNDPSNKVVFALPFIIAGGLKCVYDILLYVSFKTATPSAAGPSYAQVGISKDDVRAVESDTDLYDEEAFEAGSGARK